MDEELRSRSKDADVVLDGEVVVEEVVASSYSSLALHDDMIVDAGVEKSLAALNCYRHDCERSHYSSLHSSLASAAGTLPHTFENLHSMLMVESGHKLQ